jgi:hypothetical protein
LARAIASSCSAASAASCRAWTTICCACSWTRSGIFDFDQGTAEIDALLVDSRLLRRFPLTGGGALRARWTSPRSFALAVGGMHHGFTPPAGFPRSSASR